MAGYDLIVQCMNCFVCFIKIASGNMKCVLKLSKLHTFIVQFSVALWEHESADNAALMEPFQISDWCSALKGGEGGAGWLQCTMLQIQTMALLLALYYCASRVIDDVMNNSTVESTSFPFVQILPLDSPLDWVQFGVFRYDDREVGVTENLRSS